MVMVPQVALSPPPIPAAPSPPVAVMTAPLIRILPHDRFRPPPIPAPQPLLLASSEPSPSMVSVLPFGYGSMQVRLCFDSSRDFPSDL